MASYDMKQSICLPEKDCPRTFKPFVKTNFSFGCVGRKVGHDVTQTKCRHFRAMTKFLKHHKNNLIRWKPFLLTTSREMALIRRGMLDASLVGKWDKSCQMKSKLKWPNARFIRVWVNHRSYFRVCIGWFVELVYENAIKYNFVITFIITYCVLFQWGV